MFVAKSVAVLIVGGVLASLATAPPATRRAESETYRAFGRAVAIAGDFAFVGEPNVGGFGRGGGGRGGAPPAAGIVHIYRQGPTGWKEAGQLSAATPIGGDGFGSALAAEGTTLFVGQVSPPPAAPNAGRWRG